jgi:hypothetical protein
LPIVLVSFLLAGFLLFEARRYQYFDIWNTRLRVIQSCFYDPILRSRGSCTESDWNEVLAEDLKRLRLHTGLLERSVFDCGGTTAGSLRSRSRVIGARSECTRHRSRP